MWSPTSQWAINSFISTSEFFKPPESCDCDALIDKLGTTLSGSVIDVMEMNGDFNADIHFGSDLNVNLHIGRAGGVCDLTNWGSDEYHIKKEGLVDLLDWTPNKHPTQVHCITERHHLDDIVGEGWDDQDLKRYLGWQASVP